MKPSIRKSFVQVAVALGLIGSPAVLGTALLVPSVAQAQAAPTLAEMKQTLAAYGEFVSHAKYGEVWKPTVTPRGWHPYPACDWVYTKDFGWYFNDKTPWGAIVHHYGRWTHDATDGWLWVPGAEFSPGWVTWRTSAEWVGWAPTMPDVDLTAANMEAFDDDKLWTFMDVKKFGSTCDGVAVASQTPALIESTTYVTDMRFYGGIGVFVLPAWIVGPVINIDIGVFAPWSTTFIGSWVWNWTSIFNDVDINIVVVKDCKPGDRPNDPQRPRITPISTPPAPPAPPSSVRRAPRQTEDVRPDRPQRVRFARPRTVNAFEPLPDPEDYDRPRGRRPQFEGRGPRPDFDRGQGRRPDVDRGRAKREQADGRPRGFDEGFRPRREGRSFGESPRRDLDRISGQRDLQRTFERRREGQGAGRTYDLR